MINPLTFCNASYSWSYHLSSHHEHSFKETAPPSQSPYPSKLQGWDGNSQHTILLLHPPQYLGQSSLHPYGSTRHLSIWPSGPRSWRTCWVEEDSEESGKKKENEEDKEKSKKVSSVKKGTLANTQAKSNRRWKNGNSMVESGILGHWDGIEEAENDGEWVENKKGGTINTIITYKSQITSHTLPPLPSFLYVIISLLFHRSTQLCMVIKIFTISLEIYPLQYCSSLDIWGSASISPFMQQAK